MTQIYINASDVAACIGDNRWKSPEDVVRSQWEKHNLSEDKINTKDYMFDAGTVEKLVRAHGNVEQLSQLREIRKQVEHELATAKRTKKDHQNTLDGKLKILSRRRAMVDESDSTPQEKACMITDIVSEETLVVGNTSRSSRCWTSELRSFETRTRWMRRWSAEPWSSGWPKRPWTLPMRRR